MPEIRVFVSSTSRDLLEHRKAVIAAIRRCPGLLPVVMEDFNASDDTPRRHDAVRLADCAVYVGLFAHCHGSAPPDDQRSFTEIEYDDAAGLKRLCFLADDDFPVPASLRESQTQWERQRAFRQRVGLERVVREFRSPDALAALVVTALVEWHDPHRRPPVPNQLPGDIADFVGREDAIAALMDLLDREGGGVAAVSAIGGMGGIGKTRLAARVAHRLVARYPDAQLWVDMDGQGERPLSPAAAMARVIRAFDPAQREDDDEAAMAARYRDVLHGRRALVVLDNARDTNQVRALKPPAGCGLIVTARERIRFDGVAPLMLDLLPEPEAIELLRGILATRPGVTAERCREIARHADRLPLALRVAGEFLRDAAAYPVDLYLRELADDRRRLELLTNPDDPARDVPVVLRHSARALATRRPELAALWQGLSVFPADFAAEAAAAVWQVSEAAAHRTLADLDGRALILPDPDTGRFRLHDLMRPIAATAFRDSPDPAPGSEARLTTAAERHARHFQEVLEAADALYLKGHDDTLAGLERYDRDAPNILAAAAWAYTHAETHPAANAVAARLPRVGAVVFNLRLSPQARIELYEAAVPAARRLGERKLEADNLHNIGSAYGEAGDPRRAIECYERQLAICEEIGDRRGQGLALGGLGIAYSALGDYKRAIAYDERCLAITRETGDRLNEGAALGNLGNAYAEDGDLGRAVEFHEQRIAIARARDIGDRRGESNSLYNIALAFEQLGRHDDAIRSAEQALALREALRDPLTDSTRTLLARLRAGG